MSFGDQEKEEGKRENFEKAEALERQREKGKRV